METRENSNFSTHTPVANETKQDNKQDTYRFIKVDGVRIGNVVESDKAIGARCFIFHDALTDKEYSARRGCRGGTLFGQVNVQDRATFYIAW